MNPRTRKNESPLQESFFFLKDELKDRALHPPFEAKKIFSLAAQGLYIGTTSWKYRGWEGMIYGGGYTSEAQFQRASLREYSSFFPTVGVDFTYYAWPTIDLLGFLAESTPENFKLCLKATKRATWKTFPTLPVYGKWAGKENPEFLNVEIFQEHFVKPVEKILSRRLGVFFLDFPDLSTDDFPRLENFLSAIPHPIAVELREASLLNKDFSQMLKKHRASYVFSVNTQMPLLERQEELLQGSGDGTLVIKANVRPGRREEEANRLFQPFGELRDPYESERKTIARMLRSALENKRKAFLLVGNRFEGSAPRSIGEILQDIPY